MIGAKQSAIVSNNFGTIIIVDFEYEIEDGETSRALCMVAHVLDEHLQHVRTIRIWRGEFGPTPPFDTGHDTLFVAYSAWAEMMCFIVLGWQFPTHVFDQHTAYLAATNVLRPYNPTKFESGQRKASPTPAAPMGSRVGSASTRRYRQSHRRGPLARVRQRGSSRLLRRGCACRRSCCAHSYASAADGPPPADAERVLQWSNYSAKAVARIQARGMPIDVPLWDLVQENKAAVIGELLRRFDPSHGERRSNLHAGWRMELSRGSSTISSRSGVPHWPRLESGKLDISSDAFRMMGHIPGVEELHALRDSIGFIAKARLPIGPDGRNRPSLFPFATATGRNAHAKSPFNAHAGLCSFMLFPPDTIGAISTGAPRKSASPRPLPMTPL